MLEIENDIRRQGYNIIIGIDEAGRGPLAGPVVASAVSLKSYDFISTIGDSKKLSASRRDCAFHEIFEKAFVGIGIIDAVVIDKVNILEATYLAMNRAVEQLLLQLRGYDEGFQKICLVIDGNRFKTNLPYDYQTVIKGDAKVLSIACASIVAKVTRDRIMETYHRIYPEYEFQKHKGYPTKKHKEIIREKGYLDIHRRTFHV